MYIYICICFFNVCVCIIPRSAHQSPHSNIFHGRGNSNDFVDVLGAA